MSDAADMFLTEWDGQCYAPQGWICRARGRTEKLAWDGLWSQVRLALDGNPGWAHWRRKPQMRKGHVGLMENPEDQAIEDKLAEQFPYDVRGRIVFLEKEVPDIGWDKVEIPEERRSHDA